MIDDLDQDEHAMARKVSVRERWFVPVVGLSVSLILAYFAFCRH